MNFFKSSLKCSQSCFEGVKIQDRECFWENGDSKCLFDSHTFFPSLLALPTKARILCLDSL